MNWCYFQTPNGTGFHISSSNPNLISNEVDRVRPNSMPMPEVWLSSVTEDQKCPDYHLQEEFIVTAKAGQCV